MRESGRILWLVIGMIVGGVGVGIYSTSIRPAQAWNDRFDDYVLSTGPVTIIPNLPTDGIWMLDYRSGKLLATVIDRNLGKIINWAEADLVQEFALQPKQNVHFMMTTGSITQGQAALYIAETVTGRFGVYTMGPRPDGRPGVVIRRHDSTFFRLPPQGPG